MTHTHQHYIPVTYLNAWLDPQCPANHTPYVWLFPKEGGEGRKKAPGNVFHKNNLYTGQAEEGQRDLSLEQSLSKVEGAFTKLRRLKIDKSKQLSDEERFILCMFIATMYGRTPAEGERWRRQLQPVLDLVEKMAEAAKGFTPEEMMESDSDSPITDFKEGEFLTPEELRQVVNAPVTSNLNATVPNLANALYFFPYRIFEAPHQSHFITSDSPCVWYDPAQYQKPTPYGAGGLISPTLEISLPLSPRHIVLISQGIIGSSLYVKAGKHTASQFNVRTRFFSDHTIVSASEVLPPDLS